MSVPPSDETISVWRGGDDSGVLSRGYRHAQTMKTFHGPPEYIVAAVLEAVPDATLIIPEYGVRDGKYIRLGMGKTMWIPGDVSDPYLHEWWISRLRKVRPVSKDRLRAWEDAARAEFALYEKRQAEQARDAQGAWREPPVRPRDIPWHQHPALPSDGEK